MTQNPVARFRQVFQARLRSGNYDPIDVVQAVNGLSTKQQLADSLDVWCALFDPDRPPASRNSLELCRTTGYKLFKRALDLADATNELAELVLALAGSGPAALTDALLAKRLPVYRKRWDALDAKDRDEIQRLAKKLVSDRAAEAAKRRFLLDDLGKEFRNRKGHAPQGQELYAFDPGPNDARREFERLATACQVAYFPNNPGTSGIFMIGQFVPSAGSKPQRSSLAATQNVRFAFDDFTRFAEAQIKQPLDLFRLLAWAREPSAMNASVETTHGQVGTHAVARRWSNVWPELYQEIAIRGLYVAVNRWRVAQMIQARGYVGKDLQFLLTPLDRHWQELLKRRMADWFKATAAFDQQQLGRRRGKVWGDLKGLELVDELESESQLKDLANQMKANPKEVLERKITLSSGREVLKRSCQMYQEVEDVFTVLWIPKQSRTQVAYVEVHAQPGLTFRAQGNRVGLADLIEDKTYADLAANATALAQFMLAYLQVLGYVLDIITVGAGSGVRVVVMRFIEQRIKDAIINEGLDLAGVDNPWVRTLAHLGGGLVPSAVRAPKVGAVKGLEELERDAQNVTRGGSRFKPKPQAEEGVSAAKPKVGAPAGSAPATPTVTPRLPEPPHVTPNVLEVAPPSVAGIDAAAAKALARPVTGPGPFRGARDRLADWIESRTQPELVPAAAGNAERGTGDAAAGMARTRMSAGSRAVQSARGAATGTRSTVTFSRAAQRVRQHDYATLLERYEDTLMTAEDRVASQKLRRLLADQVNRGVVTEKDARSELRNALNDAREASGEFLAEAAGRSNYAVKSVIAVPLRKNGVPVLDVALRLKDGDKLNAGKKLLFIEAKGGLFTRLGKVTKKVYWIVRGELGFDQVDEVSAPSIRQGSGEWYYQKFAEIYMLGQELTTREGAEMRALALEGFEAAKKGQVATLVVKTNVAMDHGITDSTEEVMKWFASQKWDTSRGFPIVRRM